MSSNAFPPSMDGFTTYDKSVHDEELPPNMNVQLIHEEEDGYISEEEGEDDNDFLPSDESKLGVKFTSQNYKYRKDPANYDGWGRLIIKPVSCDTLRMKITTLLASKELTQKAFLEELDVNPASLRRFMAAKGKDKGIQNNIYVPVIIYFAEREKKEKLKRQEERELEKQQEKEAKAAAKAAGVKTTRKRKYEDIDGDEGSLTVVFHPGTGKKSKREVKSEQESAVLASIDAIQLADKLVFDDCDDIRTKIVTLIKSPNGILSMTKFAEAIDASPQTVNKFLAKKGYNEGAGSIVYERAYHLFEKYRVWKNEKKTAKRLKNEMNHPCGFDLNEPRKYGWFFTGFK